MNTRDRQADLADDFEVMLRSGLGVDPWSRR
jgi:hypothetical protein